MNVTPNLTDAHVPAPSEPEATKDNQPVKQQPLPARVVVLETVYHQAPDQQPTTYESRYTDWASEDEQPYVRRTSVGEEWTPLDLGWVASNPGMVLLKHDGPVKRLSSRDKEEVVLEVSMTTPPERVCILLPGQSMRMYPARTSELMIRCSGGNQVKYSIVAFAK